MDEPNKHEDLLKELKELFTKYNINKYILISESDKPTLIYNYEDVMEITRILKNTHMMFRQQVLKRIGEIN